MTIVKESTATAIPDGTPPLAGVTFRWRCPCCHQHSWATFPSRDEAAHYLARHLDEHCPGDGSGAPFGAWGPDDTYDTDGEGL